MKYMLGKIANFSAVFFGCLFEKLFIDKNCLFSMLCLANIFYFPTLNCFLTIFPTLFLIKIIFYILNIISFFMTSDFCIIL